MDKRKIILVYNSGPLYPIFGMNQVRIINQIKSLSKDHEVDLYFLNKREQSTKQTIRELQPYCRQIKAIQTFTYSFFYRAAKKLIVNRLMYFCNYPVDYFNVSNMLTARPIAMIVNKEQYDIIISHYWQASGFFKYLTSNSLKYIDTHYLVEENIELYRIGKYNHLKNSGMGALLKKELQLQNKIFSMADGLIVNSVIQKEILDKTKPPEKILCIPNGQDLKPFLRFQNDDATNGLNLLFYGSLSNQFNSKALRRILSSILPLIRKQKPDIKLIIMGSNPPQWLKEMTANDTGIEITGFVEDVRSVFSLCFACLIPLESGSGFRGRAVELLAAGVPIIGTSNALKSVQIEHEVNGFIAESDADIARYTLLLADDLRLRKTISQNGKNFAKKHYTREATFGKLSEYFLRL